MCFSLTTFFFKLDASLNEDIRIQQWGKLNSLVYIKRTFTINVCNTVQIKNITG